MRGKALDEFAQREHLRITPAYAGKRIPRHDILFPHEDHPRLCGEKVLRMLLISSAQGSPPPMRGKARLTPSKALSRGITPAYAGKSFCCLILTAEEKDHPRLCGEKPSAWTITRHRIGITPAYAGKSIFKLHARIN